MRTNLLVATTYSEDITDYLMNKFEKIIHNYKFKGELSKEDYSNKGQYICDIYIRPLENSPSSDEEYYEIFGEI